MAAQDWQERTRQQMLHLQLPTDPRWVDVALMSLEDILVDHAYCEQKAATSCISLIINFHDFPEVEEVLTPVVAEEWGHFERVMEKLKERGFRLGRPRKDDYVTALAGFVRKGGSRAAQLSEYLMLNALIEARSCERFKLLSKEVADPDLRSFYYELMISEAGHYVNFIQLARQVYDADRVEQRWKEWLAYEAEVIAGLEVRGDRMH
ncbi:MAG: tRNA isopentenyl-2-thiomethyl-A-37 hydroxylase MiaE [Nitritalea sp.]